MEGTYWSERKGMYITLCNCMMAAAERTSGKISWMAFGNLKVRTPIGCLATKEGGSLSKSSFCTTIGCSKAVQSFERNSHFGEQMIEWVKGSSPFRQPPPVMQDFWKILRGFCLKDIDDNNKQQKKYEGNCNTKKNRPTSQWQKKDRSWKKEEDQQQISHSKPTVLSGLVSKGLRKTDGYSSHVRDGIPYYDTRDVEEQVTEGNLKSFI